ncbi:hypothetical protein GE21DRAFT_1127497 [Neurospora crassa]|nr:hypothetical protein GE21DRAFT_1127497 [Neurospora crassa]
MPRHVSVDWSVSRLSVVRLLQFLPVVTVHMYVRSYPEWSRSPLTGSIPHQSIYVFQKTRPVRLGLVPSRIFLPCPVLPCPVLPALLVAGVCMCVCVGRLMSWSSR